MSNAYLLSPVPYRRHLRRLTRRLLVVLLSLLASGAGLPGVLVAQTLTEGSSGRLLEPVALQAVPGTQVSLKPPPGFAPSNRFPGFHRADAGASIVVAEFAAPAESLQTAMTERTLREQGMTLLSSSRAVAGGVLGMLYSVREEIDGRPYRKWMALFGNERQSVMLTASFPEALAPQLADPLKTSLLGSGWNPQAQVDKQGGLSFRLRQTDELRVRQRAGNMVVLGDPTRRARPAPRDPMLVAGDADAGYDIVDIAAFAEQRVHQLDRVRDLRDLLGEAVSVDGRPGWELTATGDDIYGAGEMLVYQLIVAEGRRYMLVQALVGRDEEAIWLPRFRQVARGLERVQ